MSPPLSQLWFYGDIVVAADGGTPSGDVSEPLGSASVRRGDRQICGRSSGDHADIFADADEASGAREVGGVENGGHGGRETPGGIAGGVRAKDRNRGSRGLWDDRSVAGGGGQSAGGGESGDGREISGRFGGANGG